MSPPRNVLPFALLTDGSRLLLFPLLRVLGIGAADFGARLGRISLVFCRVGLGSALTRHAHEAGHAQVKRTCLFLLRGFTACRHRRTLPRVVA